MFPSKPRFLPFLGHHSRQRTTEGPRNGGMAGGDSSRWPVGTRWLLMGFGFSPPQRGESSSPIAQLRVFITRVFFLQLFIFSSFQEARPAVKSVTVTSSARHQPNVTAPAPAADPAFSGKGSAVGPPIREPYQPVGGEHGSPPRPGGPPTSLFSRNKINPQRKLRSRFLASSVKSACGQKEGPAPSHRQKGRSTTGDLGHGLPQLPLAQLCPANPELSAL